jgi:hypothetical protein
VLGGHQRKLVRRQRPRAFRRQRDDDGVDRAGRDLGQQRPQRLDVGTTAEHECSREGVALARPCCDDERVISRQAVGQDRGAGLDVDGLQLPDPQRGAGARGQLAEVERARLAAPECLGDRHRPVQELGLRADDVQFGNRPGQFAQREQRLEGGHAPAGDHDPMAHLVLLATRWFSRR